MLLELQKGIIYGPIQSRRIGASLGINLLPPGRKVCTFDCLYCQYGWTDFSAAAAGGFPDLRAVAAALEKALAGLPEPPSYITFSGNGEPTMHPRFGDIVEEVARIRDRLAPRAGVAILSNSSTVSRPDVRAALSKLDLRIMKLDAGERRTFERYNRPGGTLDLDEITEGLASLGDVTIQSLFTKGPLGNFTIRNVVEWTDRLVTISPRLVQVYTLDRGCPSNGIEGLSRDELERIRLTAGESGIAAGTF